jgi:hypothetical protein
VPRGCYRQSPQSSARLTSAIKHLPSVPMRENSTWTTPTSWV